MKTRGTLHPPSLVRGIGLPGAVLMGLGSIVGTGAFVSLGLAAGVGGSAIFAAILLAGGLALCNGLSSAQLAAAHPVSGGTYEYGYRLLSPGFGFAAGWLFLSAKSASAASAALALSAVLVSAFGVRVEGPQPFLALAVLACLAIAASRGIRTSNVVNAFVVTVALGALVLFAMMIGFAGGEGERAPGAPDAPFAFVGLLHAAALMFVAYTGYGRIATLGEEVRRPEWSIPRAVVLALGIATALYLLVAWAAVRAVGTETFAALAEGGAPLQAIARERSGALAALVIAVGALAALLAVQFNLLLGLSRVALAMGRRGDLPAAVASIHPTTRSPWIAILLVFVMVGVLTGLGGIRAAWSFSAFTVLLYYGITNLAALRLQGADRRYPRWVAVLGLAGCVLLAFAVEPLYWLAGAATLAAGFAVREAGRRWIWGRA